MPRGMLFFCFSATVTLPLVVWTCLGMIRRAEFDVAATGRTHAFQKALALLANIQTVLPFRLRSSVAFRNIFDHALNRLINLLLTCHLPDQTFLTDSLFRFHAPHLHVIHKAFKFANFFLWTKLIIRHLNLLDHGILLFRVQVNAIVINACQNDVGDGKRTVILTPSSWRNRFDHADA